MRSLILALLLMFGSAYAQGATAHVADSVQFPAQDFPEMAQFVSTVTNLKLLDDGRQIVILGNRMAFVSTDKEHIGVVRAGSKVTITGVFGTIDGRHVYRITCGSGDNESHINGIRFQ